MTNIANKLADQIIAEFKSDPRNKVFVNFETLLASAREETGKKIKGHQLSKTIVDYQLGDLDEKGEAIYFGAVSIIGYVARNCFGGDSDQDVAFEIDWIPGKDSTYTLEVRPRGAAMIEKKFIFDDVAYSELDNDIVADVDLTAREVRDLEYFLEMVEIKREILELNADQSADVQENIRNDFKTGCDLLQRLINNAKAQLEH